MTSTKANLDLLYNILKKESIHDYYFQINQRLLQIFSPENWGISVVKSYAEISGLEGVVFFRFTNIFDTAKHGANAKPFILNFSARFDFEDSQLIQNMIVYRESSQGLPILDTIHRNNFPLDEHLGSSFEKFKNNVSLKQISLKLSNICEQISKELEP